MPGITGISHISIQTQDLRGTVRFYTDGLGLRLLDMARRTAAFGLPDGTILECVYGQAQDGALGVAHFCLECADCDEAFKRAVAYGARPSREPYAPYDLWGLRIAFVRTATGEEIEFYTVPYAPEKPVRCPTKEGGILALVHAAVMVNDLATATAFYKALGAVGKIEWDWGCILSLPDNREIEVFDTRSISRDTNLRHLCLMCEDVKETVSTAAKNGARVIGAAQVWKNIEFQNVEAPTGEVLEFMRVLSTAPESYFAEPQKSIVIK